MNSDTGRTAVGIKGLVVAAAAVLAGCTTSTSARLGLPELQTVPHVELSRYLGTWYEISSFPQRFQQGCTATTATYSLRSDGEIDVLNRCRQDSLAGPEQSAKGRARPARPAAESSAKLEVSFFRPFWGDYWVIDLGSEYEYAVVGHPSRDYLWVLSRTPTLPPDVYAGIVARLAAQGYQTERLVSTLQPGPARQGPAGSL